MGGCLAHHWHPINSSSHFYLSRSQSSQCHAHQPHKDPFGLSQFSAGGPGFGEEWSNCLPQGAHTKYSWMVEADSFLPSLFAAVCKSMPLLQRQALSTSPSLNPFITVSLTERTTSHTCSKRSWVETCWLREQLHQVWHIHIQLSYSHTSWTAFHPFWFVFSCAPGRNWRVPHFSGNKRIVGSIHVDFDWRFKCLQEDHKMIQYCNQIHYVCGKAWKGPPDDIGWIL